MNDWSSYGVLIQAVSQKRLREPTLINQAKKQIGLTLQRSMSKNNPARVTAFLAGPGRGVSIN